MTLACRGARQRGHTDILTKVEGREGFITVGNPVPDQNTKTEGLTATIFLNKAWVVDTDGGELRLCLSATTLATIPPVFDRVVFCPIINTLHLNTTLYNDNIIFTLKVCEKKIVPLKFTNEKWNSGFDDYKEINIIA